MDTGINLSQEQLQKLSVNQIQSLHILSLSAESLHDLLQKESEENPFMDYSPVTTNSVSSDGTASFLNFVAAPEERSVKQFILEQVNPSNFTTPQWALFSYLADHVDTRGYLTLTEEELKKRLPLPDGLFTSCLRILQSLDPAGIGAASLKDCLKLQLQRSHQLTPLLEELIENHLPEIGNKNTSRICQSLKIPKKEILSALQLIRNLNPAPLEGMFETDVTYIIPDVIIKFTPAGHEITLNDGWVASYSMSDYYVRMMQSTTDESVKKYFQTKYTRCRLLFYNIERRRQTLYNLTDAICHYQHDYLKNQGPLFPMTLADIAKEIGVHPSTISRSIKNKYLQTSHMTLSFKDLFQRPFPKTGKKISKDSLKKELYHLIQSEDTCHPYSDAKLTEILSSQFGRTFSRRLIQKYRTELHILNSYERCK
ncbi:RNA polymerase factor sigma-54 [Megasphaera sp.]|uniref:RNA polymerase factor sigma-54 n=1 Tax=Megasphaera sp. TaxID=2023260 RepID=UPI00307A4AF7